MDLDLNNFTVSENANIFETLKQINLNGHGIAFVTNSNNKVSGVVTDGDIRRALLKGFTNNSKISEVMNTSFVHASANTPREKILKMLDYKIHVIPLLDNNGAHRRVFSRGYFPLSPDHKIFARSRAPVRISFGGGGSDLTHYFTDHSGIVINATISLYSRAAVKKRNDTKIIIHSEDLKQTIQANSVEELTLQDNDMGLIISLIKLIKPSFGFELTIESEFPLGSGLGGSAVVLVAIIGCFNQFKEDKWDNYEMAEMAFQAERLLLNLAGGWQDQYASVFGGFNFMEFTNESNIIHPLRLRQDTILELEACTLLCHTGIQHQSSNIHIDQKKQMQSPEVLKLVALNKEISNQIKNNLLRGKLDEMAKLIDSAWSLKKQFSSKISNSEVDSIYNFAMNNGAKGGKLLGAGGGGFFLFFVDPFQRSKLKRALQDKGLKTQTITFDHQGLQAWSVRNPEEQHN
jgi:D-glycero-alpha-D-manno-heptose-7-phosphate kinase